MRLIAKKVLEKYKRKNRGNTKLAKQIDELIDIIEQSNIENPLALKQLRSDADCVHSEGFYFFNLAVHRSMLLIEFEEDEATVVWVGNHQEYDNTFKNNKATIEKWLRQKGWVE